MLGFHTGDRYLGQIKGENGTTRENLTLEWVRTRQIPPSMRDYEHWPVVVLSGPDAGGVNHTLELQVSPDFFKVGEDESSAVVAPMWPTTAQAVADELNLRTISTKIANAVYKQAKFKSDLFMPNPGPPYYKGSAPNPVPPSTDDSGAWAASDKKRRAWLDSKVGPEARGSVLIAGHAKDVVHQRSKFAGKNPKTGQGEILSGDKLAIYGGGGGVVDGWAIQGFPGPHTWDFGPDYSHGIRLMRRKARLDGKSVLTDDIFNSGKLSYLVSDTGSYNGRMSMPSSGASKSALMPIELVTLPTGEQISELLYIPTGLLGEDDALGLGEVAAVPAGPVDDGGATDSAPSLGGSTIVKVGLAGALGFSVWKLLEALGGGVR